MKNNKYKIRMMTSAFIACLSNVHAEEGKSEMPAPPIAMPGASAPALKIAGFTNVIGVSTLQKNKENGRGGPPAALAVPKSDLSFNVNGKTSTGYGYGYVVNFESISAASPSLTRNYVVFTHNYLGSVQVGNVKGVDDSMSQSAYTIMGGLGGISGSAPDYFNFSEGVVKGATMIGSPDIATKVNWVSPSLDGFQVGVSYTPNTSHLGKLGRNNLSAQTMNGYGHETSMYPDNLEAPFGLNNFVYSASYEKVWKDIKINLNALLLTERARVVFPLGYDSVGAPLPADNRVFKTQHSNAYQLSALMTYKDVEVAAGFLNNQKSRLMTKELIQGYKRNKDARGSYNPEGADLGDSGKAWNMGTRYTFGAYQAAVGYFQSDRKTDATNKATMKTVTTTLDFKAVEGLVFFGEVNFIKTRTNQKFIDSAQKYYNLDLKAQHAVGNNSGTVLILGTKVSF
jgi:hypothetical protein